MRNEKKGKGTPRPRECEISPIEYLTKRDPSDPLFIDYRRTKEDRWQLMLDAFTEAVKTNDLTGSDLVAAGIDPVNPSWSIKNRLVMQFLNGPGEDGSNPLQEVKLKRIYQAMCYLAEDVGFDIKFNKAKIVDANFVQETIELPDPPAPDPEVFAVSIGEFMCSRLGSTPDEALDLNEPEVSLGKKAGITIWIGKLTSDGITWKAEDA